MWSHHCYVVMHQNNVDIPATVSLIIVQPNKHMYPFPCVSFSDDRDVGMYVCFRSASITFNVELHFIS